MNDFDENAMLRRKTDVNCLYHAQLEETAAFEHHLIFDYEFYVNLTAVLMPLPSLRVHCNVSKVSQFHSLISRFQRTLFRIYVLFWPKFLYFSEVSC